MEFFPGSHYLSDLATFTAPGGRPTAHLLHCYRQKTVVCRIKSYRGVVPTARNFNGSERALGG